MKRDIENLTLEQLKAEYASANTNGTFRLWAHHHIMKTYGLDCLGASMVMDSLETR